MGHEILVVDGSSRKGLAVNNTLFITRFAFEWKFLFLLLVLRPRYILLPLNLNGLAAYVAPAIATFTHAFLFFHGQGDHKQKLQSPLYRFLFRLCVSNSYRYISYGPLSSPSSLFKAHLAPAIVMNRYEVIPVVSPPLISASQRDLLFIGRPRSRSGIIDILPTIEVICKRFSVRAHLVGVCQKDLPYSDHSSVVAHGFIDDESQIQDAASTSCVGFYFGDCGLSVIHYMSLGLCPVIHSSFANHMGPEPSCVVDNINGMLFERGSFASFFEKVSTLLSDPDLLVALRLNALEYSLSLHGTPYSKDLESTIYEI